MRDLGLVRGVAPAAAGIVLGLGLSLAGAKLIESLLFEVSPRDPVVFASVGGVLLTVAALASLLPSVRASRADPLAALKAD